MDPSRYQLRNIKIHEIITLDTTQYGLEISFLLIKIRYNFTDPSDFWINTIVSSPIFNQVFKANKTARDKMRPGLFIDFYCPYHNRSAHEQALQIIDVADQYLAQGYRKVGIIYSANYEQSHRIKRSYSKKKWITGLGGSNQGAVMTAMEDILRRDRQDLQGQLIILPMSTMNGYRKIYFSDENFTKVHPYAIDEDFAYIRRFISEGGVALGWQNDTTINRQDGPYAYGGGVTQLRPEIHTQIQAGMKALKGEFVEQEN
jgi:hypothetical protein